MRSWWARGAELGWTSFLVPEADGGGISIAKDGTLGWWHNSPIFVVSFMTSDMDAPKAFIRKDEEQSG